MAEYPTHQNEELIWQLIFEYEVSIWVLGNNINSNDEVSKS